MPETEYECISQERLQSELRASSSSTSTSSSSSSLDAKDLIILDCRSSHEYSESHIRSAVNFSIPSIMLRRLAAGKIDLLSTIKSSELKARIEIGYELSLFILYNDVGVPSCDSTTTTTSVTSPAPGGGGLGGVLGGGGGIGDSTINILHRRLKQDGCRVVLLQDGFSSFRQAFPEWCEDDSTQYKEMESSRSTQADQLMGLRSLRISTPHSDSACSSSGESSDCESTTIHHNFNEEPVEIIPGLFLGNASHSCDSRALQKYNIKYVLNVTPDLPNVFEASGGIQYLQIPITDHYSQDLAMHFPAAIQFIEEARSKQSAVLVHCLAGVSRSVTVTLAYLMHTRALCLNEAFMLVRERKPDVSPNFHFMQQLHSFERQLQISPNDAMDVGGEALQHLNGMVGGGHIIGLAGGGLSVGSAMLLGGSGGSTPSALPQQRSGGLGVSGGGGLVLPGSGCSVASTTSSSSSSSTTSSSNRCGISKFSCNCPVTDCKCMQNAAGYMAAHLAKGGTGVSPDSGIEFDRWTPAADSGGGGGVSAPGGSSLLK